ncbi:MAG: M23 family metallopeptidase [Myxococcota bacterium]|nr:M23 family metallopeptidase [Myxococcota bacterium]
MKVEAVRWTAIFVLALSVLLIAPGRPWRARRRPGLRPNLILTERVVAGDWPAEPRTPRTIEPAAFARALHEICGYMPPDRDERWAGWILQYAAEFEVDAFLIAALVYRQSRCLPDAENVDGPGLGLTQIHREMYAEQLRRGVLRWRVLEGGAWVDRERTVDRFPFAGPRLALAEPNIYFAAALLAMWRDQHETLDQEFEQAEHRHWVSHFVWGDAVRSDWEEERVMADRRRLLEYYGARRAMAPIQHAGLELGCPLDGCPRVVLSWLGAEREGGARAHRGIDVDSLPGEPVRAIADGFVYFAGVDLPGHRSHVQVASAEGYDAHPRRELGAGGRYACVRHGRAETDESSLRSCYMHLETVEVAYGQRVTRGQRIGTVGRTGMQRSAAHLHLEMHTGERLEDASEVLRGLLIGRRPADPRAFR